MRSTKIMACALLAACIAVLLASSGATAAIKRTPFSYDPATQSHPGACSQNTLDVGQAVSDLSANGILGKYAALVGVHATGAALQTQMRETLVVLRVAGDTVTANHGCTTDGLIFPVGSRRLIRGETVGVALPASIRAKLCHGSLAGCQRKVLTEHTVFPTNCWNLDRGTIQVVVYLHRPHAKPKPTTKAEVKLAAPSAHVSTACGTGNSGTSTVTLRNSSGATASADFVVNGKHYGPVAAGRSITVKIALGSRNTGIKVTSGGQVLVNQLVPADPCPAAAPSAKAALSCSAGGVIVTLSNAASATADATFDVNGSTYGPVAPGATREVTVAVAAGSVGTLTVSSGGQVLVSGASFTNSCAAAASALAEVDCTSWPLDAQGGGTLVVQLSDGASAGLPASFTVTAAGNSTSGYGPQVAGPVSPGGTQTLLIPVDGSGNPVTVTIDSGGTQLLNQTFSGCLAQSIDE